MTNAKLQMNSQSMTSSISLTSAKAMTALLGSALLGGALLGGCSSSAQWPSSPMAVSEVVALDGSKGQLSEGVAVRGKTAYLGYVGSGEVVAVDLDSGELSPYGQLPAPVPNMGFVSGLAVHGDELFGALVSFSPEVQAGVYRVRAGAAAQLYASAPGMVFPNGIAFDDDDRMYITDSAAGAVFRVAADGQVTKWLADPLLTGGKDFCGVSVDDAGKCGATLFRFYGFRATNGEGELRGHGKWGDAKKNLEIYSDGDPEPGADRSFDLYLGDGHDFGGRSESMPKFHASYRRQGNGTCRAS
jgi:hypothetical protein